MSGTHFGVVLVMWAVAISPATADPQVVAGIEIDHSAVFERLTTAAEQARQQGAATYGGRQRPWSKFTRRLTRSGRD
jgi:hypothetical protein